MFKLETFADDNKTCDSSIAICIVNGRNQCGKRRKYCLQPSSPFAQNVCKRLNSQGR